MTNIGNFEEEYLMTRNIGNRGICGLKSGGGGHTAVQAIAHPEMSPVLLQRRSLLTFLHQFRSLGGGLEWVLRGKEM